jgi:hypothetical protein
MPMSQRTTFNGEFEMTGRSKLLASSLLAAGALWCGSATAAPISAPGLAAEGVAIQAQPVQWHNHWQGRRGWDPTATGEAPASHSASGSAPYGGYGYGAYDSYSAYDEGYAVMPLGQSRVDDDVAYCQQRFRSYDPASGTYLGYDGQRHPCP